ncbi:hypothetical protein GCWU000325_00854 [Alloprevotella tannerae ATCC 51259]|uniref:Uncharacterized protein n=1 Tax=Alloprevotella tannerae ATCC 51259 TaxID=626522 RepID=C9LF72_9BACT|nr:hypothetical protein GCWU000325_00854 [Alloprevotella tannerae ATCC 51259]
MPLHEAHTDKLMRPHRAGTHKTNSTYWRIILIFSLPLRIES